MLLFLRYLSKNLSWRFENISPRVVCDMFFGQESDLSTITAKQQLAFAPDFYLNDLCLPRFHQPFIYLVNFKVSDVRSNCLILLFRFRAAIVCVFVFFCLKSQVLRVLILERLLRRCSRVAPNWIRIKSRHAFTRHCVWRHISWRKYCCARDVMLMCLRRQRRCCSLRHWRDISSQNFQHLRRFCRFLKRICVGLSQVASHFALHCACVTSPQSRNLWTSQIFIECFYHCILRF